MGINEFSEAQWREVLEEFRLLVQRAGYADWDMAMAQSLDEGRDRDVRAFEDVKLAGESAHDQLRLYTEEFMRFLKSRSPWTLEEHSRSLGRLLHTTDGAPVEGFTVVFDERERSLYERSDQFEAMIEKLNRFHAEISGESTGFWIDDDEPSDRGGAR
jgi:hypothetical protein